MRRRHFLQFAGSSLAAIGMSQLDFLTQANQVGQVLAQGKPGRKLALLVGINDYAMPVPPLAGCVNDTELQRNLLMYRYGFLPSDILQLNNAKATRQGILTAFEEHLIKQAKPGDTVVVHFSGHGSQVSDAPDCDAQATKSSELCVNSTLCPIDSFASGTTIEKGGAVNDITGHTLFLLMQALQTENVTVVLDCCHSGGGTRGNVRYRTLGGEKFVMSDREKAYRKQWLDRLKMTPEEYIRRRREGVARGVVIAGAQREQYAADVSFDGFSSGAFTYTLTRYLWQQSSRESVGRSLVGINLSTKHQASTSGIDQAPLAEYKPGTDLAAQPLFLLTSKTSAAEAVVTAVQGNRVTCLLGGVDPDVLPTYDRGTKLTLLDSAGKAVGEVKLTERIGLTAKGECTQGTAQVGSLLQESVRALPTNFALTVGVERSLQAESDTAKRKLSQLDRISVKAPGQGGTYLLGRMTQELHQGFTKNDKKEIPAIDSIGLFTPALDDWISGSFGAAKEGVEPAIARLTPKLKALTARSWLKTIVNDKTAQLGVKVAVVNADQLNTRSTAIAEQLTVRGKAATRNSGTLPVQAQKVKSGTSIALKVVHEQESPLYVAVVGMSPSGNMAVLYPSNWNAPTDQALVASNQALIVPHPSDAKFTVRGSGSMELLVIASTTSVKPILRGFQQLAGREEVTRGDSVDEVDVAKTAALSIALDIFE